MPTITRLSPETLLSVRDQLADLLCDAVNNGASVSFQPPLAPDAAAAFWDGLHAPVAAGKTLAFVALNDSDQVVGCVLLALAWQPNAPHRAEIQKLLVHTSARRQGIASQLMRAAEAAAREAGRWLIYLDTERDSAEVLYEKLGYTRAGVLPQAALNFHGEYADGVMFFKRLDLNETGAK
jgi:GNAT superfamily N-acetyltransferase